MLLSFHGATDALRILALLLRADTQFMRREIIDVDDIHDFGIVIHKQ
jgi:hypothetical protein